MLTGAVVGGLAVLCGVVANSSTQELAKIEKEKQSHLGKMIDSSQLSSAPNGYTLVSHNTPSTFVDVEMQRTIQMARTIPYFGSHYSFGVTPYNSGFYSGYTTVNVPVTNFYKYRSFINIPNNDNIVAGYNHVDHILSYMREHQTPTETAVADGINMTSTLYRKFGYSPLLNNYDIYRKNAYKMERPVFLAGNKHGNKFTYHRSAIDPVTLIDNEYATKSSNYEFCQAMGALGAAVLGVAAVIAVL